RGGGWDCAAKSANDQLAWSAGLRGAEEIGRQATPCNRDEDETMLFDGGFTFRNFVADAFAVFMLVLWFWLFVSVASDLFRRHDVSGWAKVLWVIAFLLFSYIGIFAYILTQGQGMAERNQARAQQARDELRQVVGFSAADEIEKLDRLRSAGSI